MDVCTSKGCLKCHRSSAEFPKRLVLGIKQSVCILALSVRPLYNKMSQLYKILLFLKDSLFCCPRMTYSQFHRRNFLSQTLPNDFEPVLTYIQYIHAKETAFKNNYM